VAAGASVCLCARDAAALAIAGDELRSLAADGQIVHTEVADVTSESDVERLAARALATLPSLEILVNNAGIYGPMGPIEQVPWAQWREAVETNLFGSVLLCRGVIPHFRAKRYGKIVQLSGGGATTPMPGITAYAASKAAIVRFVESIAGELLDAGVDVNALAPGALNTRMLDEVLAAGPEKVGAAYYERAIQQKRDGGASLERAAALSVFFGSATSDGITGRLISAVWDPWESLAGHAGDLRGTDVYTLRRILPGDRGFDWGNV
jgi:3-oxoacyl-[acyl-carrier protein] reductase